VPILSYVTKKDALVEHLRAEILERRLAPGTPVRQETIAERFGVSPTPVREALATLRAEGFLEYTPHRGFVVTTPGAFDSKETEVILAARAVLERFAVARLTPTEARSIVPALRANIELASKNLRRGSVVEFRRTNAEFHAELTGHLGSTVVESVLVNLNRHSMYLPGLDHETMEGVLHWHGQIADALTAGKPSRAGMVLERHLRRNLTAYAAARHIQLPGDNGHFPELVADGAASPLEP
jgi:DNA-binding GntR family transcriptional regulator